MSHPQAVLDFWFDEGNQASWFAKDGGFDARIRQQFYSV